MQYFFVEISFLICYSLIDRGYVMLLYATYFNTTVVLFLSNSMVLYFRARDRRRSLVPVQALEEKLSLYEPAAAPRTEAVQPVVCLVPFLNPLEVKLPLSDATAPLTGTGQSVAIPVHALEEDSMSVTSVALNATS